MPAFFVDKPDFTAVRPHYAVLQFVPVRRLAQGREIGGIQHVAVIRMHTIEEPSVIQRLVLRQSEDAVRFIRPGERFLTHVVLPTAHVTDRL